MARLASFAYHLHMLRNTQEKHLGAYSATRGERATLSFFSHSLPCGSRKGMRQE